jgi:amidohydrolase
MDVREKSLTDEEVYGFYKHLHQIPEIGLDTLDTSDFIQSIFDDRGIKNCRLGTKSTGVIATIDNGKAHTVGLRADIDGLKTLEETDLEYSSKNSGYMHACGHDAHAAMLLEATIQLHQKRENLNSNVVSIFQPGEEGYCGAKDLINHGLLGIRPKLDEVIALHVSPIIKLGEISYKEGAILASSHYHEVIIEGRDGHLGYPHETIDSIFVAAQYINQVQSIVSRLNDPAEPMVISFKSINSKSSYGCNPKAVKIGASVRCSCDSSIDFVIKKTEDILGGLAKAYGICYKAVLYAEGGYPVTYNHRDVIKKMGTVAGDKFTLINSARMQFGSDDFGFISQKLPSAYLLLGMNESGFECGVSHRQNFRVNPKCLPIGVEFLVKYTECSSNNAL